MGIGENFKPYGVIQNIETKQKKVFKTRSELVDFIKESVTQYNEHDFKVFSKRQLITKYLPKWAICI